MNGSPPLFALLCCPHKDISLEGASFSCFKRRVLVKKNVSDVNEMLTDSFPADSSRITHFVICLKEIYQSVIIFSKFYYYWHFLCQQNLWQTL